MLGLAPLQTAIHQPSIQTFHKVLTQSMGHPRHRNASISCFCVTDLITVVEPPLLVAHDEHDDGAEQRRRNPSAEWIHALRMQHGDKWRWSVTRAAPSKPTRRNQRKETQEAVRSRAKSLCCHRVLFFRRDKSHVDTSKLQTNELERQHTGRWQ